MKFKKIMEGGGGGVQINMVQLDKWCYINKLSIVSTDVCLMAVT